MKLTIDLGEDFEEAVKESILKSIDFAPTIKPYLTIDEASDLMGIGRSSFEEYYIKAGLPLVQISRRRVVDWDDLREFNNVLKGGSV